MDKGRIVYNGATHEGIERYHQLTREKFLANQRVKKTKPRLHQYVSSGKFTFIGGGILNDAEEQIQSLCQGEDIRAFIDFSTDNENRLLAFSINIINSRKEHCIFHKSQDVTEGFSLPKPGIYRLVVTLIKPALVPGIY